MRSVSIEELGAHTAELVAEVEAGNRLTLLRGGRVIAEMVPTHAEIAEPETRSKWASEEERLEAVARLREIMRTGFDLGGFKITDRDALYDRDE